MNVQQNLAKEMNKELNLVQLPATFKRPALVLSFLLFAAFFMVRWMTEGTSIASEISSKLLLISLLVVSISKEYQEDERIQSIRAHSYSLAFVFGVLYAIVQPYINFGVEAILHPEGAIYEELPLFVILWFMLVVQIAYFHMLKKTA